MVDRRDERPILVPSYRVLLTNRLLSVVRPRMADKTSWTKPPARHRYGDSRLIAPPSEARLRRCGLRPPEGGGERAGEEDRSGEPEEGHVQLPRPSAQAGSAAFRCGSERTGVERRRRAHEVSTTGTGPVGAGTGARISVTCSRPCWQRGQRSMSMPVRRSMRAGADSGGAVTRAGGWARRARHRASLARRVRFAKKPK